MEDGHRTKSSEKQEGTLPSRTAEKETPLVPKDGESKEKEARDENPRELEDGEPLYRAQKNFKETPGNHGGARHVPGGAWVGLENVDHQKAPQGCRVPKQSLTKKVYMKKEKRVTLSPAAPEAQAPKGMLIQKKVSEHL
ncbi:hypothetical protein NDU88_006359 [Pleurodeles waltl]|uniref:Uncharacterized protein n=1 Tax=Pleurodeles waltl TaxID=8319 RepID=A0AAV7UMR3_PLEWA|nr:hypothetical protein NDU88_006359 [Pleurodeles waltl]